MFALPYEWEFRLQIFFSEGFFLCLCYLTEDDMIAIRDQLSQQGTVNHTVQLYIGYDGYPNSHIFKIL
jgi:hypothetical protein